MNRKDRIESAVGQNGVKLSPGFESAPVSFASLFFCKKQERGFRFFSMHVVRSLRLK